MKRWCENYPVFNVSVETAALIPSVAADAFSRKGISPFAKGSLALA